MSVRGRLNPGDAFRFVAGSTIYLWAGHRAVVRDDGEQISVSEGFLDQLEHPDASRVRFNELPLGLRRIAAFLTVDVSDLGVCPICHAHAGWTCRDARHQTLRRPHKGRPKL